MRIDRDSRRVVVAYHGKDQRVPIGGKMKKVFPLFLLLSSPGIAALNQSQADKIQKQGDKIQRTSSQLLSLGTALNVILSNGGMFTLPGSTQTYTLTNAQKYDIEMNYNDLKDKICVKAC